MQKADSFKSRINADWDRDVLRHLTSGNAEFLAARLSTENIHEAAGKGAQEIRTWLAAAGVLGSAKLDVLCYEPIDALITGMGVIAT